MTMKARRAGQARRTGGETRKVLITGGSSGIGAATALAFAARGFPVAVTGLDDNGLHAVASQAGASPSGDVAAEQSPIAVLTAEIALLHARLDDLQSRLGR